MMLNTATETVALEVKTQKLDTRVPPHVRVINGSLDEAPDSPHAIVLTGRIDPNTLRFLKVDQEYQRPLRSRKDIFDALKIGTVVPAIEIGVRGEDFECDGNDFVIKSPAYIIDGWQRVGNAMEILEQDPNYPIRIFGTVHFGTDSLWERRRFTDLNRNVRKVSPNLHLRNMRDNNAAIMTLYGLANNQKDFPLYKKVCWSQNMKRGDMTTALNMAKILARLHNHISGGFAANTEGVAACLLTISDKIRLPMFRKNIETFFEVIDECWGIKDIEYRQSATQLKLTFLTQVARLFSSHFDFWDQTDTRLVVSAKQRQKLAKFPIHDPHVQQLAGSSGSSRNILYDLLLQHINSGRRTSGRLRLRYGVNGR